MLNKNTHGLTADQLANGTPSDKVSILKAFYKDDEWKNVLKEEPSCLGVDSFGDSAIVYTVIAKTKPGNQWAVGREFRKRIKKKFDKEGIDIPYNYINIIDKTQNE